MSLGRGASAGNAAARSGSSRNLSANHALPRLSCSRRSGSASTTGYRVLAAKGHLRCRAHGATATRCMATLLDIARFRPSGNTGALGPPRVRAKKRRRINAAFFAMHRCTNTSLRKPCAPFSCPSFERPLDGGADHASARPNGARFQPSALSCDEAATALVKIERRLCCRASLLSSSRSLRRGTRLRQHLRAKRLAA